MIDKSKASGDYEVGWGKPPQHSRFKKGQSGSPNGRPPKARNLKTDLVAELGARIRVREGDREVSISKQEAFIKTLVARALKGDARASSLLVNLMARLLDVEVDLAERCVVDASEKAIIDAYVARRFAEAASKSASGGRADLGDPDDSGE